VVDFGRHSEVSQPLSPQKVIVTSLVPVQNLTAASNSHQLQVRVKRLHDDPRRFELVIAPTKLPVGSFQFEITVVPQASDDERLPRKSLRVTGWVVSDYQASPPHAMFGARPVGEIAQETLTLHSLTGQHFDVIGTIFEGDGLVVEKAPLETSVGPSFVLKQQITKIGEHVGKVVFRLRTKEGKETEVVVSVSYLGIPATGN
jgi:hypothetical protein